MGRAEDLFDLLDKGGHAVIDQMILAHTSEELFLDFKQSATHGAGNALHNNDRNTLAKALSGFGNSEGGVIIWGVDARNVKGIGDVAQSKKPIQNPTGFRSWLEGAVSGLTLPPHPHVRSIPIPIPGGNDGYVATYIAKSGLAPHQVVSDGKYYMRSGAGFQPVTHGVLRGMFGHPDPAVLKHTLRLGPTDRRGEGGVSFEFSVDVELSSEGPGLAHDVFLNIEIDHPGPNFHASLYTENPDRWIPTQRHPIAYYFLLRGDLKLPPLSTNMLGRLSFAFSPPFTAPFRLRLSYGHATSPTKLVTYECSAADLNSANKAALAGLASPEELKWVAFNVPAGQRSGGSSVI